MNNLEKLSREYFFIWNYHNSQKVGDFFDDDSELRDWDVHVKGKENIINANQKIFDSAQNIEIEIINIHVSDSSNTACCEILVHLNDDKKEILKVIDVIEYNEKNLIKSLRAYLG